MALAAVVVVFLHLVLIVVCARFAAGYPSAANPILRKRFTRRMPSSDIPFMFVIWYLVFFYSWHMFPVLHLHTPQFIRAIWLSPTLFGVSANVMEHCVVALLNIFVYVNLFGASYGTGYVCPRSCATTACTSVMLLATHFAIPYA